MIFVNNTNCCAHCGLPVSNAFSAHQLNSGKTNAVTTNNLQFSETLHTQANTQTRTEVFCCTGCEAVWHMLHQCGLEGYYKLQQDNGFLPNRPQIKGSLLYLDHADFQQRHVQQLGNGRLRAELRLDGLKCGACLWLLESLPRLQQGLLSARVDLGRSVIALEWLATETTLSAIATRIASLGYEVRPIGTLASRSEWRRQDRAWLVHIAVAGAISGNVMAIAFALYGAQFSWMDDSTRQFLQWISVALATVAVFWPGKLFLTNAFNAIRARIPHMDLPIALALLAGLLGGVAMTAANRPGVYFESVSMLVFLLLVGRFVQFRQQRSARHDLELICALVPQTARRVMNNNLKSIDTTTETRTESNAESIEEIPTEALRPGDIVEISAGESVCADGTLVNSAANFDMQLLTGESRPVMVQCGETIFAGVRLLEQHPVRVLVTTSGVDTRAAAIARMVENAAGERPRVVEFANRIAGWFLLAVIIVTTITGCAWWFIDPTRALSIVIAMLVVTCPCALGLATPLTMVAALGKAARIGILIRGGDVFERLARSGTIILDKTGTVTEGSMRVLRECGESTDLNFAAALEARSTHPIAKAIAQHYQLGAIVTDVHETISGGISGIVNGHEVKVGNQKFSSIHDDISNAVVIAHAHDMIREGFSPVFVTVDHVTCAVIGVGDPLRSDALELVNNLANRGWNMWMASGDVTEIALNIGCQLKIPDQQVWGACTPERKVEIVAACRASHHIGPIVMIGDGVNDLPAMAAADVGIAVRQGARVTLEHADVALTGGGLGQVVSLLDGARRTMKTIHVNFAISLAYNIVGGALAATGVINPLIAAVLMPLSGLTVTAVALRMPRFEIHNAATIIQSHTKKTNSSAARSTTPIAAKNALAINTSPTKAHA
jgi:Cu2+-exporting ATPase